MAFDQGISVHVLQKILMTLALSGALVSAAHATSETGSPQVIGWVPAYAVEASATALEANPEIGRALTRIGLQFWNPSVDGRGIVLAPVDRSGIPVTAASIVRFRDWAHTRGIKVLLTVYNNSEVTQTWDWALARRAFKDQRSNFIDALVAEMEKYGLDGIDVDLEGEGAYDDDRAAYAAFIEGLSAAVRARGKLLTIDTFHSPCANAPNMSWWADWQGQIDALHSMGYQDLYEASEDTFAPAGQPVCENGAHLFKYSWQLAYGLKAGYRVEQIVLGQPTWIDRWGKVGLETDAASHIREAQALGAGIALWDLQLSAPGWRSGVTWDAVRALRAQPGTGWKALGSD